MCVSCCDQNYCNVNVPTNATSAVFDDRITRMRMLAKNLFKEREKALTTAIKASGGAVAATGTVTFALFTCLVVVVKCNYYDCVTV